MERTLKETISGANFELNPNGTFSDDFIPALADPSNAGNNLVSARLGALFPGEDVDIGNELNVRFVSKPRNYHPATHCTACPPDPNDPCLDDVHMFYNLLDYLIFDPEILQEAILMEYNIRTGVVLSIFYGDALQEEFVYLDEDDEDINNITGPRGINDYEGLALVRRQGFYGVRETGVTPPVLAISEDEANIYDGAYDPLWVASSIILGDSRYKVNVLYAEFLLEGAVYTLELIDPGTSAVIETAPVSDLAADVTHTNFYSALGAGANFYRDAARPVACEEVGCLDVNDVCTLKCQNFERYVWILDYIGEDETENGNDLSFSIPALTTRAPSSVRIRATRDGVAATSMTIANTLYSRELTTGNFEIRTARHLNNIRYHPDLSFRQTVDIDMALEHNVITRFTPIDVFEGTYRALSVGGGGGSQYRIDNIIISQPASDNVGLFRENRGMIDGLVLGGAKITGQSGGAFAGINTGTLNRVIVDGVYSEIGGNITLTERSEITMSGGSAAGGITGINYAGALIRDSIVRNTDVSASTSTAGGIAGTNLAAAIGSAEYGIHRSGAEYSVVSGIAGTVGGIVGFNSGDVADVYFLSTNTTANLPVAVQGGGIAGMNDGSVSRALYIAPAPRVCGVCNVSVCDHLRTLYPITREGTPGVNSFYLAGYNYATGNVTDGLNYNFSREGLLDVRYIDVQNSLITDFFSKLWMETVSEGDERFSNWKESSALSDYPYPVIRTLPEPIAYPRVGDRMQIDREFPDIPDENRRFNLDFTNGDFNDPLLVPAGSGNANYPEGSTHTFYNYSPNIPGTFNAATNPNNDNGDRWSINMNYPVPRFPGIMNTSNAYWIYYFQGFVQGWNTRPTSYAQYNNANWEAIEFQRPTNRVFGMAGHAGRALISYDGRMDTAYAELDADLASTIYQICRTEHPEFPVGRQFYYSFYHQARTRDTGTFTDRMSFFLTGITPGTVQGARARYHAGYNAANLTLIRPCRSPRSQPGTNVSGRPATATRNSRWYNPSAADTVTYGNDYVGSLQRYWQDKPQFAGFSWSTRPFVYDVWIGAAGTGNGTRDANGFGITFWTNTATSPLAAGGYTTINALAGVVTNANLGMPGSATQAQRVAEIERRIFGYWDVSFGWKHYYGLYQVPNGQEWTEFAFQSNNLNAASTAGNYLAGIEFLAAPAFLSMTTEIKRNAVPVNFVSPGETLTIEHLIENIGEVTAGTIVIQNRLDPFHELMDYAPASLTVRRNGVPLTLTAANIQHPNAANNHTLQITIPPTVMLEAGDNLQVSFNVTVRYTLLSEPGVDTWMYFIRNQGRVGFSDVFNQFTSSAPDKWNVSPVARVDISEIHLTKTVSLVDPVTFENIPGQRIDGPFRVTLTVDNESQMGNNARGVIVDAVPRGFTVSRLSGAPRGFSRSVNGSGIHRQEHITIHDINLDAGQTMTISYILTSTEPNNIRHGISFASTSRYVYGSTIGRADTMFPQHVVGLSVKTDDRTFAANQSLNRVNLLQINNIGVIPGSGPYQDDSYIVPTPDVILTHADGTPRATGDDGFVVISGPNYTLTLIGDEVVVHATGDFSAQVHYKIEVTARKTNEPDYVLDSEVKVLTINYTH
jgi:hypothetical protein